MVGGSVTAPAINPWRRSFCIRISRAFGLALSMAGGSMQFAEDSVATSVKRLHGGYSAQHGVLAASRRRCPVFQCDHALTVREGQGRVEHLADHFEERGADRDRDGHGEAAHQRQATMFDEHADAKFRVE